VSTYPVDVQIESYDRQGLLRDVSQVLANEKLNVTSVNVFTDRDTSVAHMRLTVEVPDAGRLSQLLARLSQLHNVVDARRRR